MRKLIGLAMALLLPVATWATTPSYENTDYQDWAYSAGIVVWRATNNLFHASTLADVTSEGTISDEEYDLGSAGHPWNVFARTVYGSANQNYTAPGLTLVFDKSGYTATSDAQFAPLSFGGLWVKALAAANTPYTITDNKSDSSDRTVELGATNSATYFKFDESFTFNRNSPVQVLGEAIVEIANGATFTINQRAGKGAVVNANASLFLTGQGTLAVTDGLTVNGTLDLSGANKPTISGDVTLAGGSTIKLPENTVIDATHPFTVCTGTLSSSGDVVYVKIGGDDPVKAFVTVSGGAITAVSTLATYSATIDGDTVFSNITWEKDGQEATISDMSTAILEISGSGVVTGLASAPAKVTLAAGVTLDATSIPAADFAAIVKSTSGTYRWTANYPLGVPQNYTYEYVGGETDADQVSVECVAPYFNNSGYLKTSGYIAFTNFWSGYTTSTLDVLSGKTTIGASNDKALRGTVTVRASAELVNSRTADALAYGASTTVNVYGTITMGATRWTVGSNNTINMYGGTITGEGQSSNGALDFISGSSLNVNETCEITASVRFRNALIPVTVAAEKTLTLSGTIRGYGSNGEIGGVSKRGAGNLTFKSAPNNLPRGIEHKDGHLVFDTQDDVTITNTYNTAATDTRSLWYARQSNWKGAVKVTDLTGNLSWLTGAGNADSTISLQGVNNAYVIADGNTAYTLPGTVSIDGETVFNNGSSGSTMSISNLTGSSQLVLAGWGGCSSVRYNLLNVDADWAGTLVVSNGITRTQGGTLTIGIGNIESANTNPGACVLPITNVALENATGSVVYNLDNATLNGAAADLEVKSDGVYVRNNVTISVPVVANTTIEVSVGGTPVAPATEGESSNTYSVADGATVTVTYTSDGYEVTGGTFEFTASEGYTVDATNVTTRQYIAYVVFQQESGQSFIDVTNNYTTVSNAIDAAKAMRKTVVLIAQPEATDTYAIAAGETINIKKGEFTFDGIIFPEGSQYINTTTETAGVTQYKCAVYTATVQYPGQEPVSMTGQLIQILGGLYSGYVPAYVGTVVTVLDGSDASVGDAMPEVFTYDSEAHTYTLKTMVASINTGAVDIYYPTISNAFEAVVSGQTIKVLCDNTSNVRSVRVKEGTTVTLDLNGCTVTGPSGDNPMFWLENNSNFVVTDMTEDKAGKLVSEASKVVWSNNRCTFTLTAGTLESGNMPIYIYEASAQSAPSDTRVVNVNGGKLICKSANEGDACIVNTPGRVYVTGGVIESTVRGIRAVISEISGGTVKVGNSVFYNDDSFQVVTGGTFNKDVSKYVPSSGYEILNNGDGTYTVRRDNGWMYAAPGYWDYTGTWTEGAALGDDKVTFSDGATYSNRTASAGQLVTVAMTLSFDDVNDDEDGYEGAKAAIRLGEGETEGTYVFQLYTYEGSAATWKNATGFAPTVETDYNVLFVLDLTNKTYTASVVTDAGATTNALSVGGSTTIAFANQNNATPVQQIEFVGAGTVSSIEGSYEDAPVPEGFVENDEVTLSDGTATLTAAQATWLNQFGVKLTVAARLAELSSAQFTAAYLLNLDILDPNSDYTFAVKGIAVGENKVDVTVTLTRTGALTENEKAKPIVGTLKLKGTASLGTEFTVLGETAVEFDANADFGDGATETTVTVDTTETDAKFYRPVIE